MIWMIVAVMAFEYEDGSKDYHTGLNLPSLHRLSAKRWGAENSILYIRAFNQPIRQKMSEMMTRASI